MTKNQQNPHKPSISLSPKKMLWLVKNSPLNILLITQNKNFRSIPINNYGNSFLDPLSLHSHTAFSPAQSESLQYAVVTFQEIGSNC